MGVCWCYLDGGLAPLDSSVHGEDPVKSKQVADLLLVLSEHIIEERPGGERDLGGLISECLRSCCFFDYNKTISLPLSFSILQALLLLKILLLLCKKS